MALIKPLLGSVRCSMMFDGSPQIVPFSSIGFGQASFVMKRRSDIMGAH
jgi:hypothetical protein